jgi:hypothetical protein
MSGIHLAIGTIFAMVAIGSTTICRASDFDPNLRADLDRIAQRRIYFGHQSVGVNLLDGINQLALTAGVPLHITEFTSANEVKPKMIGHTFVAKNGDPLQKLRSFEQSMGSSPTGIDIALVKFCFVDFTSKTDAKDLFAHYRATIDKLKERNPGTTFVHVTAPLTTVQGGLKARLKQFLGKAPYGTIENMNREEYNALLRQQYLGKEPIFDLARIESTAPSGTTVSTEWKGSVIPVMNSAYTDDGGHLNDVGKLRASRELISVLASIPNQSATHKVHH